MAVLQWNRLAGQERVKGVIGNAFQNGTLGHAYLFCGERGTGKFAAAVDLAMAVLCCHNGTRPCGECPSCKKVNTYSHPDFHIIMPVILEAEHRKNNDISEKGWQFMAASAKSRIDDPYKLPQYDKKPDIPVDWIREANQAILRGATEGAYNAVIIDGVDSMKKESANAMLKTLEEPPPGTVMILLTDKAHSVLPTILSRCQMIRFAPLPHDVIAAELVRRFGVGTDDSRVAIAAASGSLGVAIDEFENPREEYFTAAADLWNDCLRGNWEAAAQSAEYLSGGKDAFSECQKVLSCLIDLLRFAVLSKTGAPINYFYSGQSNKIELPEAITPTDVENFVKLCQEALFALNARGNAMLVMVNFVCTLMEMLNVEEQQAC
ncbi:MAG: DNA polymerase III subunit [Chitinispirillales bacterium]|jgi:DNA polymerase III delta' subunit|nr:DNA polymerase III subunit [Chitinispirillales bacterium]